MIKVKSHKRVRKNGVTVVKQHERMAWVRSHIRKGSKAYKSKKAAEFFKKHGGIEATFKKSMDTHGVTISEKGKPKKSSTPKSLYGMLPDDAKLSKRAKSKHSKAVGKDLAKMIGIKY